MSNIDKQWLQQKIAEIEDTRDDIPFGLDEDDGNTLAALRIALASLEAEAVSVFKIDHESSLIKHVKKVVSETNAPPAPVSVPDMATPQSMRTMFCQLDDSECAIAADVWNACRAAMLQGAEPVTTANKLPELTDSQCLEFLAVAFRLASIKGDIEFNDIRLGLKMALEAGSLRVGKL